MGDRYDSYVLCTSPRSGSTLLCDLLTATGVAGRPRSYFHEPSLSDWLACYDLAAEPGQSERETLARIFDAAIVKGRAGSGLFGLRLQRHSFEFFLQKLAVLHPEPVGERARIAAAFGRTAFIHLTRQDKVEQAISYVKAQQTGLWHAAPDGTELERLSPPRPPAYDAARIGAAVAEFTAYDRDWERWFAAEGLDPLRLTYDALSADPVGTLRGVLAYLGLDPDAANNISPGVAKLADNVSVEWAARFRAETDRA